MKYSIVPHPQKFDVLSDNTVFTLTKLAEIESDSEKAKSSLLLFLSEKYEMEILGTGKERIIIKLDSSIVTDEGYTLKVSENLVEIYGKDEAGLFYGVQSLIQLLICGDLAVPEIIIEDAPRFSYRGFMLDCGRYFFTVDAVKHFLELMAVHKLNVFHWHLSEDQGFRFYSEKYPLLTEIGSRRSHTNFNTTPHEGFYSKQDMLDIIEYAHDRFIKVIPEIDSPGHVVSMIAAYPYLSCFDRKMTVATHWGVKHDVLCIGKESTYKFMYGLLDELCEIFTDGIIHLGGDEVPSTRWKICPHCQALMKKEGMKDEGELHTYYLQKMADYLKAKGMKVCMWNDTVKEKMVDSDVIWQLWNTDMPKSDVASEINKGRPFIISAIDAYYLDLPYGQVNLKDSYEFDMVYEGVKKENEKNIMGIEGCLWAEFVPSMDVAHYTGFPRFGAVSESAWTEKENRDYGRFYAELSNYYRLLKFYSVSPANKSRINPKGIKKAAGLLYWERRKLCWQGLHNLIDNYNVKKKHGK